MTKLDKANQELVGTGRYWDKGPDEGKKGRRYRLVWNGYDWYSCRKLVTVRGMKAVEDCTVAFVNGFHEGALGRAKDVAVE